MPEDQGIASAYDLGQISISILNGLDCNGARELERRALSGCFSRLLRKILTIVFGPTRC